MVKNYFYLIAGILCILFAALHALNGYVTILPVLDKNLIDVDTKTALHYVWHSLTAETFVVGIVLMYMAFYHDPVKVRFAARMIILLMAVRWVVILFFVLLYNKSSAIGFIPDTIAMLIIIGVLLLGIRIKKPRYNTNFHM